MPLRNGGFGENASHHPFSRSGSVLRSFEVGGRYGLHQAKEKGSDDGQRGANVAESGGSSGETADANRKTLYLRVTFDSVGDRHDAKQDFRSARERDEAEARIATNHARRSRKSHNGGKNETFANGGREAER